MTAAACTSRRPRPAIAALALGSLLPAAVACAAPSRGASAELDRVVTFVEEVHPAPYLYIEREQLAARLDEAMREMEDAEADDDMAMGRALHRLLASLGDGHIALGLRPFQSAESLSLLPLLPVLVEGRVLVDAADPPLPPGTELVAIEGRPLETLWPELRTLVMSDGPRTGPRDTQLQRDFPRYLHLGVGLRPEYRVTIREPNAEARELVLPGVGPQQLAALGGTRQSAPRWERRGDPTTPPWPSTTRIEPDTVVLHLPSFGVPDHQGYRARVDEIFAGLAGHERLVLDLRGNEGGFRTHGIAVLNHLIDRPYTQWTRIETRVRSIPRKHRPSVDFPIAPESALTEFPGERRGQGWVYEGDPLASMMQPGPEIHTGPIVAFIDGRTSSAAVELLAALLAHREGVRVIGEETRGECGRHTGEIPVAYNTRQLGAVMLLSLAEITLVPVAGCRPGRGFEPHAALRYTLGDFLEGRDPYLALLDTHPSGAPASKIP